MVDANIVVDMGLAISHKLVAVDVDKEKGPQIGD